MQQYGYIFNCPIILADGFVLKLEKLKGHFPIEILLQPNYGGIYFP